MSKSLGLVLAAAYFAMSCQNRTLSPNVPLDLTVSAGVVDGLKLPVRIEERPGASSYLTLYRISFTPDGLWSALAARYPEGAAPTDLVEIQDNGWYEFDGASLLMHSNFSHAEWGGTIRNDTITASVKLPFAATYHTMVLP